MSHPNSSDERGFLARAIMQHNLVCSKPDVYTWSNSRGSSSKIGFVMVSNPAGVIVQDVVHTSTDYLLGCDHRAVSIAFKQSMPLASKASRTTRSRNKCGQGKWMALRPYLLLMLSQKHLNWETWISRFLIWRQ